MANLCDTEYVFFGKKNNVKKCLSDLQQIQAEHEGVAGHTWIGHLIEILLAPLESEDFECRGSIYWLANEANEYCNDTASLSFSVESAWTPCNDIIIKVAEKYDLEMLYLAVEPGCGIFETNDSEERFFNNGYYCDTEEDVTAVSTFDEAADMINDIIGKRPKNIEEAQEFIDEYNNEGEHFISLNEIDVV